jgi:hypothetical protein
MKKLLKKFQPVDLVLIVPAIIGLIYSLLN